MRYRSASPNCNFVYPTFFTAAVQLTSDVPSFNGFICPLLTFNCIVTDVPSESFRWYFNDVLVGGYLFQDGIEYPLDVPLNPPRPDVMIQIVNAYNDQGSFNYNATLTANSSSLIQEGVSITCGSLNTRSNAIRIDSNMMIRGALIIIIISSLNIEHNNFN